MNDAQTSSGSEQPNRGPDSERLLSLLEAATEGSRELDAEVGAVAGLVDFHCDEGTWFYGLDLNDDHGPWEVCPAYTTSLDAALTLVPAGWGWLVQNLGNPMATLFGPQTRGRVEWAKTPALALCIAALKAKAQMLKSVPSVVPTLARGASSQESPPESNNQSETP